MMKKLTLLISLFFVFQALNAQSIIDSIYFEPEVPTTNDTIYVYTDLVFPSTGCVLEEKGSSFVDGKLYAWTHHCLGAATAICETTDTFKIDPLPAGEYPMILTLTTGLGELPCTPGIIADDVDTVYFKVVQVSSTEMETSVELIIFPNPAKDRIQFNME